MRAAGSSRYPHSRASSRRSISLSSLGNAAATKSRAEVKAFDDKGTSPNRRGFCGSAPIILATNHRSQCDLKLVDVTLAHGMQPSGNNVGVDCYPGLSWNSSLAHNGRQIENFLAQIAISVNLELRTSRTTINTFGEETPGKFLGHGHSGCETTAGPWHEIPGFCASLQKPLSAAFAGDLYQNDGSRRCLNLEEGMGKAPQETIEHRMV